MILACAWRCHLQQKGFKLLCTFTKFLIVLEKERLGEGSYGPLRYHLMGQRYSQAKLKLKSKLSLTGPAEA